MIYYIFEGNACDPHKRVLQFGLHGKLINPGQMVDTFHTFGATQGSGICIGTMLLAFNIYVRLHQVFLVGSDVRRIEARVEASFLAARTWTHSHLPLHRLLCKRLLVLHIVLHNLAFKSGQHFLLELLAFQLTRQFSRIQRRTGRGPT